MHKYQMYVLLGNGMHRETGGEIMCGEMIRYSEVVAQQSNRSSMRDRVLGNTTGARQFATFPGHRTKAPKHMAKPLPMVAHRKAPMPTILDGKTFTVHPYRVRKLGCTVKHLPCAKAGTWQNKGTDDTTATRRHWAGR